MPPEPKKRLVAMGKPPKPIGDMNDEELDAFANEIFDSIKSNCDKMTGRQEQRGPTT